MIHLTLEHYDEGPIAYLVTRRLTLGLALGWGFLDFSFKNCWDHLEINIGPLYVGYRRNA